MQSSLEKLRKYFTLEKEKGFDNTSIIGGLSKMLDNWEGDARGNGIKEEVIQAVVQRLRSYDSLTPQGRKEVLTGIWKRIAEVYPEAGQKPARPHQPYAPAPRAEPAAPEPQPVQESSLPVPRPAPERPYYAPPPGRAESTPGGQTSATPAALNASLTVLQGVGPKTAASLSKLGMQTLGDMLYYFPFRYEDYSQLKPIKSIWYGEQLTVVGTVQSVNTHPIRGGKSQLVEVILSDGTGALRLKWFNQPWVANRLRNGDADFRFR